jgi:CheY-like chemotaxis protein
VRDTGVGMMPGAIGRVFRAFEQGNEEISRKSGGLGLGLAISKSLIEQHNGKIVAESEGSGRGATFTVEIPVAAAPDLPSIQDRPSPVRSHSARVLLVEDHEDTAVALAKFLQLSGYAVKRAEKGSQALQMLAEEPFDLVVSDIGLPDMTGYDLMKTIQQRWGLKGIAMSGYGMEEDIRKSRESGFNDHLVKPVKVNVLAEMIRRLL